MTLKIPIKYDILQIHHEKPCNIDPGTISFEERGILVKESVGKAQVPVARKHGADGEVSVRWRTIG